ncbi:MAG: hypothetical protein ACREGJ_00010 [Candidatus Saccharimonadales bacterium]
MAETKTPAKAEVPRLTGLKKRQQIETAGKVMFIWVAIAAAALSFCIATTQYLFAKWQYNNKVIGAKYEAIDTLKTNIANAEKLKQEIDGLVANQDLASVKADPNYSNTKSILDALPTKFEPAALATSLQQVILARSGVTIEAITVPPEEETNETNQQLPGPTPQELTFSFVVAGSYDQIKNMVADLERTIRPIKINTISLTGNDANLRATLEVITYYQPAKTDVVKNEVIR